MKIAIVEPLRPGIPLHYISSFSWFWFSKEPDEYTAPPHHGSHRIIFLNILWMVVTFLKDAINNRNLA